MLHPEFRRVLIAEHEHHLADEALRARSLRGDRERHSRPVDPVLLRLCRLDDDPALELLAALEGRPAPAGRYVVAEVSGSIVAALPLAGGKPLADPFRPTAHLLPLLRLRADQLTRTPGRSRSLLTMLRWSAVRQ
jgi:hypothetical protein